MIFIHFHKILSSFNKITEILVKNIMKTADAKKLFLAIFERT